MNLPEQASSYLTQGAPTLLPSCFSGKEYPWQRRRRGFDPSVGKIPWKRKGNPLQFSCLENSTDKRSPAGCRPRSRKRDRHEWVCTQVPTLMVSYPRIAVSSQEGEWLNLLLGKASTPPSQQELITSPCYLTLVQKRSSKQSALHICGFGRGKFRGPTVFIGPNPLRDVSILRFWYLQVLLGPILWAYWATTGLLKQLFTTCFLIQAVFL